MTVFAHTPLTSGTRVPDSQRLTKARAAERLCAAGGGGVGTPFPTAAKHALARQGWARPGDATQGKVF